MALFAGILFGCAMSIALTQAGLTWRSAAHHVIAGSTLGSMAALYAVLLALGYTKDLATLVSALTTFSVFAGGFAWHQRHRRAR